MYCTYNAYTDRLVESFGHMRRDNTSSSTMLFSPSRLFVVTFLLPDNLFFMCVYICFVSKKIKKNDFKNRLGSPEANFSLNTNGKNVSTPEVPKKVILVFPVYYYSVYFLIY